MSLRRRVIIGFVAVAAVLIVSNVALSTTFRSFLLQRVDQQLVANATPLGARGFGVESSQALTEYFVAVGDPTTGQMTQVNSLFDPQQSPPPRLTIGSVTEHLTVPGQKAEPYFAPAASGGGKWRMIAVANPYSNRVTVLGISLDALNATVARMREIQIFGSLAVLGALAFVSSWVMRLGVHPIASMARTAEEITSGGDLSLRVDHPDEATEAGRLGASFNRMLERIQEAFRAREESEARVRRFAADASHELRTPLTSIRGYAELYRAGGLRGAAEVGDAMERIESEAQRMGSLVDELLQLARLDQEQELEFTEVDLGEIANDAANDARAVEPVRPITVHAEAEEPVIVRGNEPALRQVLANLLANVRAHTPAGTPASVHVAHDGEHVTIVVADEGSGMDAEVAAQVFERFFRADAARTRAAGGTGLGLSIVESIARAHGGTASVQSAPGEGARFEVKLPITT